MLMDTGGLIAMAIIGVFYFGTQALLVWVVFRNTDSSQWRKLSAHIFGDDQIRGLGREETRDELGEGPGPAADRQNRAS